ncbi:MULTISPECIES: hypothetical protein [unclassified Bradyrhizobium]|uniref:hypothetical protein n=1 Tax=unclassified Bradyrhizobium TaxID=2631580 RepID=UPI0033948633
MDHLGQYEFSALSIKDLIEARDLYHFHLMSKDNVVGTAVGSYLIRDTDPKDGSPPPDESKVVPRTLFQSHVRSYSWPCVLVFVREWFSESDFGPKGKAKPWQVVPKTLFLPDGRAVPVCTVLAQPVAASQKEGRVAVPRPTETFGGGLALHVEVQGEERFGTAGCLVTDGHLTYALTARHVCGAPGTELSAELRQGQQPIGVSAENQLTRQLFSEVYPAFPMRQTWLGIDAGLVKLERLGDWTPNIYGLPPIRPMLDLYEQNLSLKIIDSDVVAIGAASGLVRGKVKALFYRYRSTGGFDYVSDFLISPEARELGPRHGDSGMLWQIADRPEDEKDMRPPEARPLRPLAIEWGAQVFANGNVRSSFSVASALSTVCRLMGVDLVVPGDDSVSGTWGAFGHYSIGRLAVGLVKDAKLKRLLEANIDAISVGLKALGDKDAIKEGTLIESGFVPLADVADIVWKKFPEGHTTQAGKENGVKGGRDVAQAGFRSTGPEHPQHHCDADGAFANYRTLREACLKNSALLSTSAWIAYYEGRGKRSKPDYKSGVLPFRVWQYFEAMRGYAATDLDAFVAAAGTLAHYVGDASQPLHCTSMHDGDEDRLVDGRISKARSRGKNTPVTSYWGEGVHSSYETQMIGYAAAKGELLPEITKNFGDDHGLALVTSGKDAAMALVQLMEDVADTLPPVELIRIFEQKGGFENGTNAFKAEFWKATRDKTGKVMALGARYLAMIWDAAWVAGNGQSNRASDLVERDKEAMKALYEDTDFVPSLTIDQIGTALNAVGSFSANQKPNMIKNAAKKAPKKSAKKTAKKTRASRPRGTDD